MNKYFRFLTFSITLFLLLALNTIGQAAVYNVTNNADIGAGSLRDAISSANSSAGCDTIRFNADYTINLASFIEIRDSLVIIGTGIDRTIIDGGSSTNAFSVFTAAGYASFNYLTIRNTTFNSAITGAAISSGSSIGLNNVKFTNNISNVTNAGSSDAVYGGAVSVAGGGVSAVIDSCIFENNQIINVVNRGRVGGGAFGTTAGGSIAVSNSTFTGNASSNDGGAIYSSSATFRIGNNTTFTNNKASYRVSTGTYDTTAAGRGLGGAVYASNSLELVGALVFQGNATAGGGGAIGKGSAGTFVTTNLTSLTITNNIAGIAGAPTAYNGFGGGIYTAVSLTFTASNNVTFTDNIAYGSGGAIHTQGTAPSLVLDGLNPMLRNTAELSGGAISAGGPLTLKNITISDSKAGYHPVNGYNMVAGKGGGGGAVVAAHDITLAGDIVMQRDTVGGYGGALYWTSNTRTMNATQLNSWLLSECAAINSNAASSNPGIGGALNLRGDIVLNLPNGLKILNNSAANNGGGIYTTANVTLQNAVISNNISTGANGGGIFTSASAVTLSLTNTTLSGNAARTNGGGIYSSGPIVLNNDSISNNKGGYNAATAVYSGAGNSGGGIYASDAITLQGTVVLNNNIVSGNGGAIWKSSVGTFTTTALTGITVDKNAAVNGFGGGIYSGANLSLKNAIITNNTSFGQAGGIYTQAVSLSLQDAQVLNNRSGYRITDGATVLGSIAGGIRVDSTLTLQGTLIFENNIASGHGGAIWKGASGTFIANTVTKLIVNNNKADSLGGGIYIGSPTADGANWVVTNNSAKINGGGIYSSSGSVFTLNNSLIDSNTTAGSGGGIFAGNNITVNNTRITRNVASVNGGGIYANTPITLNSDTVSNNQAVNGGGLFLNNAITLRGNMVFDSNKVTTNGGAIWKSGTGAFTATTPDLNKLTVTNNTAGGTGGGIHTGMNIIGANWEIANNTAVGSGGGINTTSGVNIDLSNSKINGNKTSGSGGGIYVQGNLTLNNDTVNNNISKSSGGGIYAASVAILNNITISNNRAGYDTTTATWQTTGNGGGVYANNNLTLGGAVICQNNMTAADGGGIYKSNTSTTTLSSSGLTLLDVSNNVARTGYGGGIYIGQLATLDPGVGSISINNNTAKISGGGISAFSPTTLKNASISNNRAGYDIATASWQTSGDGGGLYSNSSLTLSGDISILNDTAAGNGGGIYKGPTGTTFSSSGITSFNVSNNVARTGSGGGIYTNVATSLDPGIGSISVNNNTAKVSGGGIYAVSALTIKNTSISNNRAGYDIATASWQPSGDGGGIYANNDLTLSGAVICQNDTAANNGGGIYRSAAGSISSSSLTSLDISNNVARIGVGGGIYAGAPTTLDAGTAVVSIANNTAKGLGGGIYTPGGISLTLNNPTISGNRAGYDVVTATWGGADGGGLYVAGNLKLTGNVTLDSNQAGTAGGGIFKTSTGTFDASNLTSLSITNCVARGSAGGGINSQTSATIGVTGGTGIINNNTAKSSGGGLYTTQSYILENLSFSNNRAGYDTPNAAWLTTGSGGAVFVSANLELRGTISCDSNMTAADGGAIYKGNTGSFSVLGALKVSRNTARTGSGGGIYTNVPLALSGVPITNNTAGANGGGIYAVSTLTSNGDSIKNNTAGTFGGGVYVAGTSNFQNAAITNNKANSSGGGIYANKAININNGVIAYNRSGVSGTTNSNGGGIYLGADSLVLTGNIVFLKDSALQNIAAGTNLGGGAIGIGGNSAKLIAMQSRGLTSLLIDSCYTNNGGDGGAIGFAIIQQANTAAMYLIGGINCPITISNNFADRNGGAISARCNTAYLQNIYFYKNGIITGSGIGGGAVFLSNPVTNGAAIAFDRSVSQCTFEGNTIPANNGAAIAIGVNNTQITPITNSTFYNNKAAGTGAASAIYANSPTTVSFSTFYGNTPARSINGAGGAGYTFNGNILQDNIGTSTISGFTGLYNIVGSTADITTLGGTANKNQVISTPSQILTQLAPINNGGATNTMLIKKGALAHNFIPVDSANKYAITAAIDQRDSVRPVSCGYDAGAVELQISDSDPDGTYVLKYDAVNNPLSICGATLVNLDTLISNTTNIKDTVYFADKNYSIPLANPLLINGSITKDTIIYVHFITTNNCVLSDSIKIKYSPVPTASFVNDTLVCSGFNTALKIKFTGAKPFSFTYNNPQGNPVTINNYNDTIYILPVSNVQADSTFTLVSISSIGGCTSTNFTKGSATVTVAPRPTIKIQTTGDFNNVCDNAPISLSAVVTSSPEYTQTFFRWETFTGQGNFAANVGDRNVQYDAAPADQAKLIWIRARYQNNVCVGYYAMDSVQIRVLPLVTTASAEIISQPVAIQNICVDTSYIVKIATQDLGSLKNVTLSLVDNNSSHLLIGNAYLKYPYDAAGFSITPLTVLSSGGALGTQWKIADSLNGKDSLQVKVEVSAKCNFSSGKTLQFNVDATDYCGTAITQIQKQTAPFYTDNDLSNVNTFSIFDELKPDTVRNNTSDTVLWTLRTVVHGSQVTDSLNESVRIFIPTGITPVPGSFINIKNSSLITSFPQATATGTSYEIAIRSGLTEGDSIISSLKLVTTGLACGTYYLQHEIKFYDSVTCSGTPCITSASLVNKQNVLVIERYRFSNITGTGTSANDKWTGTINITAVNPTYVGDTIIIDFYKDMDNDGKLDGSDILSATVLRPTVGVPSGTVIPLPFTDISFEAGKQLLAVAHGKALCDTILLPLVTIDGPSAVCQGDTTYLTMPSGMSTYNWKLINPTIDATSGATPTRFIPQGDPGYPDNYFEANRIGISWANSTQTRYPTGTFTIYSWYTLPGAGELAADTLKITVNRRPYLQVSATDTNICRGQSVEITHFFRDTNHVGTFSYYTKNADGSYTLLTQTTVTPNDTTVYAAYAVVSGSDCKAFDTVFVKVNVNPLPEATISNDGEICSGDEIDLTFTLTSGKQLPQWKIEYMEGAVLKPEIINNLGTNTLILPVSPTVDTVYLLKKVTDGNGCVTQY